jgi:hypothetical protein
LTSTRDRLYFEDMSESVVSDRSRPAPWQCARIVAEENARDVASPNPSAVQLLVLWFKGVQLYHEGEAVGAATEEERPMQKHMLSTLISTGEWLVMQLRQHDVTSKVDVTLADVEATLEELYVSQRVWFGGMTEARRTQVIEEVFGAS